MSQQTLSRFINILYTHYGYYTMYLRYMPFRNHTPMLHHT